MSSLRILQVLPALNIGGVERVTLDMVKGIRQLTDETFVATQNGILVPELHRAGGTHISLPLATKNPVRILRNAFLLAKVIRDHDIQVVHARSRAPAWSAFLATRLTKVPFVTTYHSAYNSTNAFKKLYNSVMTRGDRVIAISEFIFHTITSHYPNTLNRVRLIPEGIDVEEFNPHKVSQEEIDDLRKSWRAPPNAIVFLVPSRIRPLKGQTIFIEAIRRLNYPHIVGVILGETHNDSPYLQHLRSWSEGLPIRFMPHTSNTRLAYAAADFVVNPTLAQEAFGRITAEAGAMERVVIATNHGATTELCLHGKTGLLVPPGDARALTDAMIHLLKLSPEACKTMSKAAREHITEKYSLNRMYAETLDLYRELVL